MLSITPSLLRNWYTNIVRHRYQSGLLTIEVVRKLELNNCSIRKS
jgi:hypothetical protein